MDTSVDRHLPVPHPPKPPVEIEMRPFQDGDEAEFRELNRAWIAKYFTIEEPDRVVLADPVGKILRPGGHIFLAVAGGAVVGCCALLARPPAAFEVAKMAVS